MLRTKALPMKPAPPVTRMFCMLFTSNRKLCTDRFLQPDFAIVAERELKRAGTRRSAIHFDVAPDQAAANPRFDVVQAAVFQHDAVFNLTVLNGHMMVHTGERSHIAVDDARAFADDGGTANGAANDIRAPFHRYPGINRRFRNDACK